MKREREGEKDNGEEGGEAVSCLKLNNSAPFLIHFLLKQRSPESLGIDRTVFTDCIRMRVQLSLSDIAEHLGCAPICAHIF